jgi:serine O-acetyltransferase
MFNTLRQDLLRWVTPGKIAEPAALNARTVLRLFWQYMPVRATALFRLATWFKQRRVPLLPGLLQRANYAWFGLEIPSGAAIGGGLYIPHPVGAVIMPHRIGRNCSIIASVTIGMRDEWAFPDIGDNVFIGAGARVLGGIRIGDGAIIGANAVVIHDVAAGATAVGVPARIIRRDGQPADAAQPAQSSDRDPHGMPPDIVEQA